ncbi:MAG: DEAD/DEAH box helicase [Planctomycetes bacterium]|nr:DEAD/DEAH box helicase [Planctomycetota bacterium]
MASKRLKSDIQRDRILEPVRHYWGFRELRPLQEEAIRAGLDQRDSVVVLPTGGGKSLCYQVPPLVAERVDVVVSPLIALMKDQVDQLRDVSRAELRLREFGVGAELVEQPRDVADQPAQQQQARMDGRILSQSAAVRQVDCSCTLPTTVLPLASRWTPQTQYSFTSGRSSCVRCQTTLSCGSTSTTPPR